MRQASYKSNAKTTSPPATVATPRTPIYLAGPLPDTVRPEPVEACPEALEGGPPPPAAPATPHSPTPHPDTSPFPPTPPNPYPTPMNTATHTATTTTKAPANTHARSAQSTPPRIPNRPPGIVSPDKEQSRNATQTGQGNSTTPTTREPHPDTTSSRQRPSYHSLMEHLIASTFAPLRSSPARPASTSACSSAPIPGRLFPPGEDNFRLVFKMCQTSYRTIHQNNLQQPRQPGKQPPPLRNAGHLLTAPVGRGSMMCMTRLTESQPTVRPHPARGNRLARRSWRTYTCTTAMRRAKPSRR